MKRAKMGGLDVVLAGGSDGHGGGDGACVVLLHGFGAPGEDLVPLTRYLAAPRGTRFVFPAAPLDLGLPFSDARAWWMIDIARFERGADWTQEVPPGMEAARAKLEALLDELKPGRLVLGGFSQGAMLSLDVALRRELPLAGLVLWSGTIVAEPEWAPRMRSLRGKKLFLSHGRQDPLLPYFVSERLRMLLETGGVDVRFVSFSGGHEIPQVVLEETGAFLAEVLG
jgi:phospholipase/carboxylesterase